MIWLAIRYDGRLYVQWCSDHMNGIHYQWMLEGVIDEGLLSTSVEGKYHVFQQDNASVHTTARTKDFFDIHGMKLLPWPAQSPDLNIVEHIYPVISRHLPKQTFRNRDAVWEGVQHAIRELECCTTIKALYESMPTRIQQVMQARGGSTSY